MSNNALFHELMEQKLIAIFRGVPLSKVSLTASSLEAGGIRFIEICFDQKSADPLADFTEQFNAVRSAVTKQTHVGAGTVLTPEQLRHAHGLGCEMIVSPCTDPELIRYTKSLGMLSIPGAMTPTEIANAYAAGADLVKLYIVDNPGYVQMLQGPLGHIPLQVTCNVSLETIPHFLKAGVKAFGIKAMLPNHLLEPMDCLGIQSLASQFCAAVLGTQM